MDKRTAKALEASIAHWERNVAAETPDGAGVSGADCALCAEFRNKSENQCGGCPVRDKTGLICCLDTPYASAVSRFVSWIDDPSLRSAWRAAAQRELDFLKSLRAEAKE